MRVHDLMNEKEDMIAIHQSDSSIKEHLIARVNELDKITMERSTELLFSKRQIQELQEAKSSFDCRMESVSNELNQYRTKTQSEIGNLKD